MARPRILAVIVLYKRTPEASETFTSLREILRKRPDLAVAMSLLVYDNSPVTHEIPALPIATRYISNAENGGLAPAYNAGLQMADEDGAGWLLLLDQDTVLTEDYLAELIPTLSNVETSVSAVLPKLVDSRRKRVISPTYLPRIIHQGIDKGFSGMAIEELTAVNSAATLRVKVLKALGGFPNEHPIEFLDVTIFHLLHKSGEKIWVMDSVLLHNPSMRALGTEIPLDRYKNVLYAERDFYMNYRRNVSDHIWYRLRKLKNVFSHLLKIRDKQFAMWDLRAAVGALKRPHSFLGSSRSSELVLATRQRREKTGP